jgi:hypothetical protein
MWLRLSAKTPNECAGSLQREGYALTASPELYSGETPVLVDSLFGW